MTDLEGVVAKLGERSQEIDKIINVITDISTPQKRSLKFLFWGVVLFKNRKGQLGPVNCMKISFIAVVDKTKNLCYY